MPSSNDRSPAVPSVHPVNSLQKTHLPAPSPAIHERYMVSVRSPHVLENAHSESQSDSIHPGRPPSLRAVSPHRSAASECRSASAAPTPSKSAAAKTIAPHSRIQQSQGYKKE